MKAITSPFYVRCSLFTLVALLLALFLVKLTTATEVPFAVKPVIDDNFQNAQSVYAADLDGDGDLDILGAAQGLALDHPGLITWWENNEGDSSSWSQHIIDSEQLSGATSVYAADMDGDGDLDVLGALRFTSQILWWENKANDTLPAEGRPDDGAWAEHRC